MNKQIGLKRYEMDGRKVLFYFDEVGSRWVMVELLLDSISKDLNDPSLFSLS